MHRNRSITAWCVNSWNRMALRSLILAPVLAQLRKAFTGFYRLWKAQMSQCQKHIFCTQVSASSASTVRLQHNLKQAMSAPNDLRELFVLIPAVVAPPVGAPRGVPHRWVGCDRCHPSGAAADAGREAAARVRGAARAAEDGVVDVPQALHGSPSAPPIPAQRVVRFDPYHARNCLPPQKLRREIP
jgi:hypothetical protein